jgi:co-chaperonin GroES (HSP10)
MPNNSGHEVLYDKVLVHLDQVLDNCTITPEGDYKKGFLIYSREQMTVISEQETEGRIVYIGETAFDGLKKRPKVGDRITFPKYNGFVIYGDDGQFYRRLYCKDIGSIHSTKKK